MFYPEKRDGYSRRGRLRIDDVELITPALIEFNVDSGIPEIAKKIDFGRAPYPLKFISEDLFKRLGPSNKEVTVLTGLWHLSPKHLVQAFQGIPKTNPIYAAASATPWNLALLVYLGADIVDNILAVAMAYNGTYFLGDLEIPVSKLKKFPCSCRYCKNQVLENMDESDVNRTVAGHNTELLRIEIEKCRRLIDNEEMRNYVEARVKLNPEMTASLRIADATGEKASFARFKKSRCLFSAVESVNRFEVSYFLNRAVRCYKPVTDTVLLLPCTARKPYLTSKTHRALRSKVKINVNEIIISSPLVVPREFELTYPAINYDTPVTGHWTEEEISFVAFWLKKFIERGKFRKVVAHVEGGYRRVVEKAVRDLDTEIVFTAENGILNEKSVKRLKEEIDGYSRFDLYHQIFDHMLRYQFEIEAEKHSYRGRYPEIEMLDGKERVARVDTKYGMLDIYEKLARLLLESGKYTVEIGDFDLTSTVFAAGVVNADERIRPNDIVVFHNSSIFGVGIAFMDGREMTESKRGIAIKVKRKFSL
ncbi:archaeosine synthase subunit alpha [Archaeoglobus neptunius]|uniref:archaeosine synthase subunit alpha n=1 Tax=Archaeoglobus neptunius TaxID=2798580 RepID=UPI0019284AD4|nr:archaeosine synthase subunit alpha [Archaeoglobus neptunius]